MTRILLLGVFALWACGEPAIPPALAPTTASPSATATIRAFAPPRTPCPPGNLLAGSEAQTYLLP